MLIYFIFRSELDDLELRKIKSKERICWLDKRTHANTCIYMNIYICV